MVKMSEREAIIRANMTVPGVSRRLAEESADAILADKARADAEEEARHAQIERERTREIMAGRLTSVLTDLDELGTLSEREARLYFAVERFLFPENECFRPENLEATERVYLSRVG